MNLPPAPVDGGWQMALAATAVSGLAGARRALRAQVLAEAGAAALPATYICGVFVGWPEIRAGVDVMRANRGRMLTQPNPFGHLEFLLSELHALSSDDDPPVLLVGIVTVTADPALCRG